jgi:hypothetical protein
MAKVNSILDQRMNKKSVSSKMSEMAKRSTTGDLTSFSGIFNVTELSSKEQEVLAEILRNYAEDEQEIQHDLNLLISITSEVKAITNQAALLHGERIKKAHQLLIRYRDGAFTAWLMAAYGNRQTPYNLMQYYEFCEAMPKPLRPKIELMPRQAIYVLASREGSLEKKKGIVENYQGETKSQMLSLIRASFPLDLEDKRKPKMGKFWVRALAQMSAEIKQNPNELNLSEKERLRELLEEIRTTLDLI